MRRLPPNTTSSAIKKLVVAMVVGTAGGSIFAFFSLPLAWMMGAMLTVTVAALAGLPVAVPNKIRAIFVSILGVMLGSAFTPDLINEAGQFGAVLLLQIIYMLIACSTAYLIYRLGAKYDPITSYFSSTPGGLSEMTLMGEQYGGDARIIPVNHSIRILMIVTVIPFYFRLVEGLEVPVLPPPNYEIWSLIDAALLVGCIIIGYPIAVRIRLPAAPLIGPMILSAAVHLAGLTEANVPSLLIAFSQLMVGTALGCRFTERMAFKEMFRVIVLAIIAGASMIIVAIAVVSAASLVIPIPRSILFLSVAPGGLAEMSLIALALGTGTAFVTVMHFLRVTIVLLFGAAIFRITLGK